MNKFITLRAVGISSEVVECNDLVNFEPLGCRDISLDANEILQVTANPGNESCTVETKAGRYLFVAESRESVIEKINLPDDSKPRRRFAVV